MGSRIHRQILARIKTLMQPEHLSLEQLNCLKAAVGALLNLIMESRMYSPVWPYIYSQSNS